MEGCINGVDRELETNILGEFSPRVLLQIVFGQGSFGSDICGYRCGMIRLCVYDTREGKLQASSNPVVQRCRESFVALA